MTIFSWQFDPLDSDPNNVEITADGVAFAKTSTLSNAQKLVKMLNDNAAQCARSEALEKALGNCVQAIENGDFHENSIGAIYARDARALLARTTAEGETK